MGNRSHWRVQKIRAISILLGLLLVSSGSLGQDAAHHSPVSAKHQDVLRKFPLTKFYDTETPLPAGKPGQLIRSEQFDRYALSEGVQAVRILYYSVGGDGQLVASSGVVLFPDRKPPSGGWPVIAWAHEANGVARACAPSLLRNLLHGPFLSMYVNLGYAVVATDYAGLGSKFRNAFADMRSNAHDVIYSVPAARSAVPGLGSRWIAMGMEEGAAAVVAVGEIERQTPDSGFLGGVALSRISDLEDAVTSSNASSEMPLFVAFGVKTVFSQFEPKDILTEKAMPLYEQAATSCEVSEAGKIPIAEMLKAGWRGNQFVQKYLSRNQIGNGPMAGPLLVLSSEGDPGFAATARSVMRLCKQGDRVVSNHYGESDPGGLIGDSARDQMAWIQERFAGRPARSNCP